MKPYDRLCLANRAEVRAKYRKLRCRHGIIREFWHAVEGFHGWRATKAFRKWQDDEERRYGRPHPSSGVTH